LIAFLITLVLFNTPIAKVKFQGNKSISDRVLAEEIISHKGDEYNEVNTDFDIKRIIRVYETQGFFKTEVTQKIDSIEDGTQITFSIKEGSRPRISKIRVIGAEEQELKNLFAAKVNNFFIEDRIIETENRIKDYYKNRGYPYADVNSEMTPDSGLVIFTVEKYILHYIRNIEIQGLKTCKQQVVRREIEFKKGNEFSKEILLKSQRRIYALGFFGTIDVEILKGEPDSIDLFFKLKELKSRIMNFGAGLSIPLGFLISFSIEEMNMFNLGHRFQIRPSFKINIDRGWETKLEGRYTIPYVTPLQLSISILPFFWFENTKEYSRQTRGNEFRVSKLFTENIQFTVANQYKYVDFHPKIVLPDTFKGITNSIKLQFMFDYRNEFFNPKKGLFILPLLEYAGGPFGGANNFIRLEIEKRLFLPFLKNTIAQRLKLGTIIPTNGMATYEKYYIGGQYTLRGYPERTIGPDSIGSEKYGNIIGNYNLEYRLHLPYNFGIIGFFDVGYIDNKIDLKHTDYIKTTAGFGLRYYTPIGPARLDIGFPLAESGREIYFGIYHIF
jgi:outer membrane protein insertion porin family